MFQAQFSIGQVIVHKKFNYRGVILMSMRSTAARTSGMNRSRSPGRPRTSPGTM